MYRRRMLSTLGAVTLGAVSGCSLFQSTTSDQPFRFETSVRSAVPTADGPPVVEITVSNTDSKPHILTISNQSFPFATAQATTAGSTLVLDERVPDSRESDCWRGIPQVLPMVNGQRFDPSESVTAAYAVLNAENTDECWPTKTFEFVQSYYPHPKNPNSTEQGTQFDWGFSVTVDDEPAITIQDRTTTTSE